MSNMIKRISLLLVLFLSLFWFSGVEAKTYYYDSIEVEITVNEDSTFDVTEKMTYKLDGSSGFFYRDIEMKNLDHLSDVRVFDNNEREIFDYDKGYNGNRLHIQWNFPRREYYNELKSWTVQYRVHGGLGFFDEYDEIYWNAIFSDRTVSVEKAKVIVHLPISPFRKVKMFIGETGNKDEYKNYFIDGNSVNFSGENIGPDEYLTIAVSWPKGIVTKPFIYRNQLINWFVILIALLIPLIAFIKMFRKWWKDGRDPKITKTVIAQYGPPANLSPAVMGVLLKESVDVRDILATVVNLAVRGYLKIREEEKKILFIKGTEYIFEKLKNETDLKPFEQAIMQALFGGGARLKLLEEKLSKFPFKSKHLMDKIKKASLAEKRNIVSSTELRNKFYASIPEIKKEIHKEVAKEDLFNGDISETRMKYSKKYLISLISSFFGMFALVFVFLVAGLSLYIPQMIIIVLSIIISSIIGLVFSYFMPALTQKGLDLKWKALGFGEYLHTAERFRIGTETLETFSKFLPYAMVFKVEKQWAERFSDFTYQEQGWYTPIAVHGGSGISSSSFSNFSSSFSSFADSVSSTFSSSPGGSGTGGGGSSGGGGGGGGGGAG